jgi:hypothetical protein
MDELQIFGLLKSFAVIVLGVVFTHTYGTGILQVCYPSIDIHLILLHVRFDDKLSISVSKTRATRHNNLQLEIVKFLKKSNVFKGRAPLYFTPRPFPTSLCAILPNMMVKSSNSNVYIVLVF